MLVALVAFIAVFIQSSVGFGLALVSMPLLVTILGIQTAAPLVAILAVTTETIILLRYRHALQIRTVSRLVISSLFGVPLGVILLGQVDAVIVTTALGVILIAYALYALLRARLPLLAHKSWAYGFGFIAGILGGAYNTSGPPVIIYGNCRNWPPDEFKSNLQGFFVVTGASVFVTHALSGNYTATVLQNYLYAVPGAILGLVLGFSLDGRLNPERFRIIVLVLLIILGIRLIIG